MQAGQALLRAFSKAELTTAEKSRYENDLKAERDKTKTLRHGLKVAKAKVVELEKERDEATDKAKRAERKLVKMQKQEKKKMKEVDGKAFQAGYDRVGAEYVREARKMVNDEIELRMPIAYRRGYKDGVKAACGVL